MNKKRVCEICGADISNRGGSAKYCIKCAEENKLNATRLSIMRRRRQKSRTTNSMLSKKVHLACQFGISYGRYMQFVNRADLFVKIIKKEENRNNTSDKWLEMIYEVANKGSDARS